jgi:hypothetical protein
MDWLKAALILALALCFSKFDRTIVQTLQASVLKRHTLYFLLHGVGCTSIKNAVKSLQKENVM